MSDNDQQKQQIERARRLNDEIDRLLKPEKAEHKPTSTVPSPREFIERRMREMKEKSTKDAADSE